LLLKKILTGMGRSGIIKISEVAKTCIGKDVIRK